MLNETDARWLYEHYPDLVIDGDLIAGPIAFRASYSPKENCFRILDGAPAPGGAVALSGSFQIRIEERADKSTSHLPALYVSDVDHTPDRHFNQKDSSACLCNPLEEHEFTQPFFRFQPFLEQLVIPFLYGQIYYSAEGHWPWAEYAHGATGILEAYSKVSDSAHVDECLQQLAKDSNWPRIRAALRQEPFVKGHTPCFCTKMDHIRRCHPRTLDGARRLQQDIKAVGLRIP